MLVGNIIIENKPSHQSAGFFGKKRNDDVFVVSQIPEFRRNNFLFQNFGIDAFEIFIDWASPRSSSSTSGNGPPGRCSGSTFRRSSPGRTGTR